MRYPLIVCIVLVAACSGEATPAGTVLVSMEGPSGSAPTEQHRKQAALPLGAKIDLSWTVVRTDQGGKQVSAVTVTVADGEGWALEAVAHGEPTNTGSDTGAGARVNRSVMVTQNRSGWWGQQGGQTLITLSADGAADLR
ncbi:MAG: hypothetical protein AAFU77_10015 [Myxococcota bacterium]